MQSGNGHPQAPDAPPAPPFGAPAPAIDPATGYPTQLQPVTPFPGAQPHGAPGQHAQQLQYQHPQQPQSNQQPGLAQPSFAAPQSPQSFMPPPGMQPPAAQAAPAPALFHPTSPQTPGAPSYPEQAAPAVLAFPSHSQPSAAPAAPEPPRAPEPRRAPEPPRVAPAGPATGLAGPPSFTAAPQEQQPAALAPSVPQQPTTQPAAPEFGEPAMFAPPAAQPPSAPEFGDLASLAAPAPAAPPAAPSAPAGAGLPPAPTLSTPGAPSGLPAATAVPTGPSASMAPPARRATDLPGDAPSGPTPAAAPPTTAAAPLTVARPSGSPQAPPNPFGLDTPPVAPSTQPSGRSTGRDLESLGVKGATTMQLQGKKLRIGEVLIDMGMIDQGQLEHALKIQKETGQRLGKVLISEGLVSATDIAKALSRRLSIEFVDLGEMSLSPDTLSLIPFDTCTRYDVVPIGEQGGSLIVAMADPTNVFAFDDLRLVTGRDVRVVVASPDQIDIVLSRMISLDDAVSGAVDRADDWDEDHVPLEDIKNSEADAPAVLLVNQIITQAVVNGVSDLHFEPQADDMVVRFRKDGVLQHVTTVPGKLKNGVTSRLKIMASLDISERRKPQDGRVGLRVGDKPIDLRVASLPTVYGEKTVLRVLDKSNVMLDMTDLGFLPEQLDKLRYCYTQPYGCLLVTGPTGSGKSTTLYGAVNEINDIEKNIITVEDPVEYRLKGINQVQVNNKAGLSFAAALKSILRCDPDIVMIGEMRDHETAAIGVEAALTGHLVLSTLHTNTAPGAITRLTEMGIEPYLVSSSVLGVLAQRLARRLCKCAEHYTPEREYLVSSKFPEWAIEQFDAEPFQLRRAVGCERCSGKGFKGRMGLHEVMLMSEEIAKLAIAHASAEEIEKVAIEQGMITLWTDGVRKIIMGQTTMEELQRIVQS